MSDFNMEELLWATRRACERVNDDGALPSQLLEAELEVGDDLNIEIHFFAPDPDEDVSRKHWHTERLRVRDELEQATKAADDDDAEDEDDDYDDDDYEDEDEDEDEDDYDDDDYDDELVARLTAALTPLLTAAVAKEEQHAEALRAEAEEELRNSITSNWSSRAALYTDELVDNNSDAGYAAMDADGMYEYDMISLFKARSDHDQLVNWYFYPDSGATGEGHPGQIAAYIFAAAGDDAQRLACAAAMEAWAVENPDSCYLTRHDREAAEAAAILRGMIANPPAAKAAS